MHRYFLLAAALAASVLSACATTKGSGTGSSLDGKITATFGWADKGGSSGDMTASLNTGERFAGPYFQVTHESRIDNYRPLWAGWDRGAAFNTGEWRNWGPTDGFVTEYTGRVLANLASTDGRHMRCAFRLRTPSAGLSQGGSGRCQLPDGHSIDALFPMP